MELPSSDVDPAGLEWSRISARGPDAISFLQGQLSQDVSDLGDAPRWTAILAPDSVVIAAGQIRTAPDGADLVVARDVADEVATRLRRFLLRTRCALDVVAHPDGPFRTRDDQIDANWPGPAEFQRGLTPHSFGAAFVASTVSFDKGCFTGQELVARLDSRSARVPWRLVRARAANAADVDEVLRSAGPAGASGVTSVGVRRDLSGQLRALGIVHRTFVTTDQAHYGGVFVEEVT